MSRQSPYALRARLKGEPFDLAWQAALQCRFDVLVEAAMERALHGVEVPHFYRGELVGTSRRYDERLTVALLMMRDKFALPYMPSTHPGFAYSDGEFGKLLDRVEQGPETWAEQQRLAFAGPYDPDEVLDAYDDDYDDYDDYDGNDPDDCANERANAGDDLQGDGIAPDWYVPDGPDA